VAMTKVTLTVTKDGTKLNTYPKEFTTDIEAHSIEVEDEDATFCLTVQYTSQGGTGEASDPACIEYHNDGMTFSTGAMVVFILVLVIGWAAMTLPQFYILFQINGHYKEAAEDATDPDAILLGLSTCRTAEHLYSEIGMASFLDASELCVAALIILGTVNEAGEEISSLMIAEITFVAFNLANLIGANALFTFQLSTWSTANETFWLDKMLVVQQVHAGIMIFFILPELIGEIALYVENSAITDLICITMLSLDIGTRINTASSISRDLQNGDWAVAVDLAAAENGFLTVEPGARTLEDHDMRLRDLMATRSETADDKNSSALSGFDTNNSEERVRLVDSLITRLSAEERKTLGMPESEPPATTGNNFGCCTTARSS